MIRRGDSRPRLLYVAFWFPPSRASGVYRALATTRSFHLAGWETTVVTTTRTFLEQEVGSVDLSLETQIPSTVQVERVPFSFWEPPADLRSLDWLHANFPQLGRRLDRREPIDRYEGWIDQALLTASRVASKLDFDHILATGNPFSSFEVARILSERIEVPYSVDYRDPWTIDVYTGAETRNRRAREVETRVLRGATSCFQVNLSTARAYAGMYPGWASKQVVAENGFDLESLGPVRKHHSDGPLTFGILGTVTERWPLRPIIEAWRRAEKGMPQQAQLILGGHLGYFERSGAILESLLHQTGDGFSYVGPIDKADVPDFYARLDVVVVPVPGGELVTSGKIYEALALGVPVVCVQEEGGGARDLLRDHPLAFAATPSVDSVTAALENAARAASTITPEESTAIRQSMMRYERSETIRPIVETIEAHL